jgi:hypothetical protein
MLMFKFKVKPEKFLTFVTFVTDCDQVLKPSL